MEIRISMVLCFIFPLFCCVYHTIVYTHHTNTRVLAHAFIAKLFVQIRRNKQMLILLWNGKKGLRLRLLSRLFIFCIVKKYGITLVYQTNKQTKETHREYYIHIEIHERPKKQPNKIFVRNTKISLMLFFPSWYAIFSLLSCLYFTPGKNMFNIAAFFSQLARMPVFLLLIFLPALLVYFMWRIVIFCSLYNMCVWRVRASVCLCAVNRHQLKNVHEQ